MTKPETEALAREIAEGEIPPEVEQMLRWREETLDPELEAYCDELKWGKSLRHPLVYDVPLTLPGMCNKNLRLKKQHLEEAIAANDLHQMVFLHERPWRCWALVEYVVGWGEWGLPRPLAECSPEVVDLAVSVWVDSENIHQNLDEWTALLEGEGWLMGNREAFDALPDPVSIYRGDIADGGWSWTTDLKIAKFFAQRFTQDDLVYAEVAKEHVFGYLTTRGEDEILVRLDAPINIIKRVPYDVWSKEKNG